MKKLGKILMWAVIAVVVLLVVAAVATAAERMGVFMRQVSPCITVVRLLPGRCQTTPCRKRHAG